MRSSVTFVAGWQHVEVDGVIAVPGCGWPFAIDFLLLGQ